MKLLNGWKRIGIVLSVLWALWVSFPSCRESWLYYPKLVFLWGQFILNYAFNVLVPIILGWLLVYLIILVCRWVKTWIHSAGREGNIVKHFVAVIVTFMATVAVGQDSDGFVPDQIQHAPSIEQCRADQAVWFARLEDTDTPMHETYLTLPKWSLEMRDCEKVDPQNRSRYRNVRTEISAERVMRGENFLDRHSLWNQFLSEDAAGER